MKSIAAALASGEKMPTPKALQPVSVGRVETINAVQEEDDLEGSEGEDAGENPPDEEPAKRKKPTRRAGRRARHRRCHAAEARRLAEEAAKAAAGELPEGSVQDANLTTSVSSGGMG